MINKEKRLSIARKKVISMKARPATVHVITSKNGWAVKREGTKKASLVVHTKSDAITRGRHLSGVKNVIIHRKDGTVERRSGARKLT